MGYTIVQDDSKRESFAEYKYRIYRDGKLIANYWHDYRGDEHGIDFVNGSKDSWPVGRMIDFIDGGGPQPLVLSQRAMAYLDGKAA
ncbi:hypothetical protein [Luteimonas sp. MC1828]|uniref:hypothetical protein n=1 Tax=Luteimonas sp. MC1828 TaxID=2799787 RepID=UPI0018F13A9D|nr:hypothetical protein [Luteimonas sp. MC1828]MBJ7575470.1 hypothetical protein [Luteimonas sp. MC1828]